MGQGGWYTGFQRSFGHKQFWGGSFCILRFPVSFLGLIHWRPLSCVPLCPSHYCSIADLCIGYLCVIPMTDPLETFGLCISVSFPWLICWPLGCVSLCLSYDWSIGDLWVVYLCVLLITGPLQTFVLGISVIIPMTDPLEIFRLCISVSSPWLICWSSGCVYISFTASLSYLSFLLWTTTAFQSIHLSLTQNSIALTRVKRTRHQKPSFSGSLQFYAKLITKVAS